jgi:hypothetical protein
VSRSRVVRKRSHSVASSFAVAVRFASSGSSADEVPAGMVMKTTRPRSLRARPDARDARLGTPKRDAGVKISFSQILGAKKEKARQN